LPALRILEVILKRLNSYVLGFGVFFLFVSFSWAKNLRIYHIDVEQGAATLFVSPGGRTLLVDSGKNGHGARIKAVMDQAGVTQIDHFVNTHYHEDHYGGIDELPRDLNITIGQAYDRGDKQFLPASKLNEARFRDYQDNEGVKANPYYPRHDDSARSRDEHSLHLCLPRET
jgi:beta-lactamase superfamily II metal-dependent hydrolase